MFLKAYIYHWPKLLSSILMWGMFLDHKWCHIWSQCSWLLCSGICDLVLREKFSGISQTGCSCQLRESCAYKTLRAAFNRCAHQYSCLENHMYRGAWLATVHGFAKSQPRLSGFTFAFSFSPVKRILLDIISRVNHVSSPPVCSLTVS